MITGCAYSSASPVWLPHSAIALASEQTRKQIAEVLHGDFDKSALWRNAVRLIVEEALEAEGTDVLGRGYDERGEPAG